MISNEARELINSVWLECDKDDDLLLQELESMDESLVVQEALVIVRYAAKTSREDAGEVFG